MLILLARLTTRNVRRYLIPVLLAFAFSMVPGLTDAASTGCRGDPIIYLSNGQKLQVLIGVNVEAAAVLDVTYTVHVPVGVNATSINMAQSTTTLILASKEHVIMVSDLPAKQYRASTIITTTRAATGTVTAIFTPGTTFNATGPSGVPIVINTTGL